MRASDILSYAFSAIRLRKLRAGLTTLGVVIGIAAIVALLSITQGLQTSISKQLQTGFATNTLIVSSGRGFVIGSGVGAADSDFKLLINYTQLIDGIDGVSVSAAVVQKQGRINHSEGEESIFSIVGVDFAKYASIYSSTFLADRGEIPLDPENEAVVVGKLVADPSDNETAIFDIDDAVEITWTNTSTLPFQDKSYAGHIAAVLKEIGGFGIGPSDFSIYIPIPQAQTFFGTDECNTIIVQLDSDDSALIESVTEAIEESFSDEVSVTSSTAILSTISSIFATVELFLAGIAAISLLVAGIGIMNIMIVSLMERTREIGILKALGMKSRTVLLIFLSEALIIGLMGGVIGLGSGWLLANIVTSAFRGGGFGPGGQGSQAGTGPGGMAITPVLTPTVILGALTFGILVSTIFALYPAWRASKLKPVEALRYE